MAVTVDQPTPSMSAVIVRNRHRVEEIVRVLGKYGLAGWVRHSTELVGSTLAERAVRRRLDPDVVAMSDGERLRRAFAELGSTWVKLGQMLSLRADWVGDDIAAELARLQEHVPADAADVVRSTVERELAGPVEAFFSAFDLVPIASGSVAQVHRATLHDGTDVAVKVLHDGIEATVLEDLALMRALASYLARDPVLARLQPRRIADEFAQMMHDAINLSQELANLVRFTANFRDERDVVLPTPFPELSRRRILTMSMVTGAAWSDRAGVEATGWDVDALVDRAAAIFLEMIFRDSFFHADPHPGNLRLPDASHLALLDFGDVGQLSGTRRRQLEDMLLAVVTRDVDELVEVFLDMTGRSAAADSERIRDEVETWLDRHSSATISELDVAETISSAMRLLHDNELVLPADLALLFRVLLRLQGLGRDIGADVRLGELLEAHLRPVLSERFDLRTMMREAGRSARTWERFITTLPGNVEAIMHQLRAGQLAIDFNIRDADGSVDHLVDGIIAAAAVLASAELIARRVGPALGSLSLPGVAAAGLGLVTWQRLVRRRRARTALGMRAATAAERHFVARRRAAQAVGVSP